MKLITTPLSVIELQEVDWWLGNPVYRSTDAEWEKYFYHFYYAARV